MSTFLVAALTSTITGLLLQPLLIPWLRRRGVIDIPNHRSSHTVVTPRGGGIAVLAAIGVGLLVAQAEWRAWLIYAGCLLLGGLGLVDDFRQVDARIRLAGLLCVGAALAIPLGSPVPTLVGVLALAIWVAAYVNAFNFMDGINGISALCGIVSGAAYAAMGVVFGVDGILSMGAALVGACLSFLPFNLLRARVFLGDVGSYGIGFAIAGCAWLAWGSGVPLLLALSPTLVYLADTGSTLLRRARVGAPLLVAHREHAYQRLVAAGRRHVTVAALVAGLSAVCVVLTWTAFGVSSIVQPLSLLALVAGLGGYLGIAHRETVTTT